MTRKKHLVSEDDKTVWDSLAKGVRPLKGVADRRAVSLSPLPSRVLGRERFSDSPGHRPFVPGLSVPGVGSGDPGAALSRMTCPDMLQPGCLSGMDRKNAERLRKGRASVDATLDLHGMTQDQAQSALSGFIRRGFDMDWRVVVVVTGRGSRSGEPGVLRSRLPHWLNGAGLRPFVVGFTQAQPKDGGAGAFYVRLRRHRDRTMPHP